MTVTATSTATGATAPGTDSPLPLPLPQATRLVQAAIRRATRTGTPPTTASAEDLQQEGLLAVFLAGQDFDPTRGVPFEAYAAERVRYAIAQALRAADPLPDRTRADLGAVRAAQEVLAADGTASPTAADIAARTGLSPSRVLSVLAQASRRRMADVTATAAYCTDRTAIGVEEYTVASDEARHLIHALLQTLSARDRTIVMLRYRDGLPVRDIAAIFNIDPGRVSQITTKARTWLTAALA